MNSLDTLLEQYYGLNFTTGYQETISEKWILNNLMIINLNIKDLDKKVWITLWNNKEEVLINKSNYLLRHFIVWQNIKSKETWNAASHYAAIKSYQFITTHRNPVFPIGSWTDWNLAFWVRFPLLTKF